MYILLHRDLPRWSSHGHVSQHSLGTFNCCCCWNVHFHTHCRNERITTSAQRLKEISFGSCCCCFPQKSRGSIGRKGQNSHTRWHNDTCYLFLVENFVSFHQHNFRWRHWTWRRRELDDARATLVLPRGRKPPASFSVSNRWTLGWPSRCFITECLSDNTRAHSTHSR